MTDLSTAEARRLQPSVFAHSRRVTTVDFAREFLAALDDPSRVPTATAFVTHAPPADDDPALPPFRYAEVVVEQGFDPILERTRRELAGAVVVYSSGLVMCSACAPASASRLQVEAAVNAKNPTGIPSRWQVSDDEWHGREPGTVGPIACDTDPGRTHWLLAC